MTSLPTEAKASSVGSPTSNGSGSTSGRKTLDLEPNPFEQSFAGPTEQGSSAKPKQANRKDPKDHKLPTASSPPVLTPGGTRRTTTSNMLPPLPGIMSPGAPSIPGTPGMWSSMFQGPSQQILPFAYPVGPSASTGPAGAPPTSSQQQQMYSQSIANAKRTGLTPNESSLRTGLTPGSNNNLAHHNYAMLMSSGPFTPGSLSFLNMPPVKTEDKHEPQEPGSHAAPSAPAPAAAAAPQTAEPKPKKPKTKKTKEHAEPASENGSKNDSQDEEKRKSFLERNRIAASKCRQRKKQMVQKMQQELNFYSAQYDTLTQQVAALQDQVKTLHSILYGHKDCPSLTEQMGGVENTNNVLGAFAPVHLVPAVPQMMLVQDASRQQGPK
ncbi:hypothetical protein KL911_002278 [Ogataea haglerorum]|uniref:uncharacterized protein n=1 Tax=Ogataea haglerorum TaxID=1937702 RepID=UPI001C8A6989|nr:uncharacterized protein KL911_002278 [Ogataea haglerorum]KAG7754839.1 hypothetical protein KL911_002278 [Ogataea haglerorum]